MRYLVVPLGSVLQASSVLAVHVPPELVDILREDALLDKHLGWCADKLELTENKHHGDGAQCLSEAMRVGNDNPF